jgi:hypothetical protein
MKVGSPSADSEKKRYVRPEFWISMIAMFAISTGTTDMLRFAGAIVGIIALFWLIGALFDRWDKKAQ